MNFHEPGIPGLMKFMNNFMNSNLPANSHPLPTPLLSFLLSSELLSRLGGWAIIFPLPIFWDRLGDLPGGETLNRKPYTLNPPSQLFGWLGGWEIGRPTRKGKFTGSNSSAM